MRSRPNVRASGATAASSAEPTPCRRSSERTRIAVYAAFATDDRATNA